MHSSFLYQWKYLQLRGEMGIYTSRKEQDEEEAYRSWNTWLWVAGRRKQSPGRKKARCGSLLQSLAEEDAGGGMNAGEKVGRNWDCREEEKQPRLLRTDNFSFWRTTILPALECFDLASFVLAPAPPPKTIAPTVIPTVSTTLTPPPASIPDPEFATWTKQDCLVLLWLKSTVTDRILVVVVRCTSSSEAWVKLERNFQSQTTAQRMALKVKLQPLTKGSSSMIDYLDNKRHIADSFLMQSANACVDDLIGLLLHEEARIEADLARQATVQHPPAQTPPTTSPFPAAHQASCHNSTTNNQYAPPSSGNSFNYCGNEAINCLYCQLYNKPGHEAINCWQRGNQKNYPSFRPNSSSRDPPRQAHITTSSSPCAIRDQAWYFDTV
ncbi:hypothetical protein LXL04_024774 [Taraxacum kok-saghyz]